MTEPKRIELSKEDTEDLLGRIEKAVDSKDYEVIKGLIETIEFMGEILDKKNVSVKRLLHRLFGFKTEKTDQIFPEDSPSDTTDPVNDDEANAESNEADTAGDDKESKKGHGRNDSSKFTNAKNIDVKHDCYCVGDKCPLCPKGKLFEKQPSIVVRIKGEAPIKAEKYHLQRFRCSSCGATFKADLPQKAGKQRFDAEAVSMLALFKYGYGFPFHRMDTFLNNLGMPLADSTIWDVLKRNFDIFAVIYDQLFHIAAQAGLLYIDDTNTKILDLIGKRREKMEASGVSPPERKGIFTTGIVAKVEDREICLFFSGPKHAGENILELIKKRSEALSKPMVMCDASSRNTPDALAAIIANCIAHARRKFVDVSEGFPAKCKYVLEQFKIVYKNDSFAAENNLSDIQRLQYHKTNSETVMNDLRSWMSDQLKSKKVEPNSSIGASIKYNLNHWDKLTLFLREPGAPLDNNICERGLKKAILNRKNAMFFRSMRGAEVGDMYMSLIHTCELVKVNPFEYLTEVQKNINSIWKEPEKWLPWNYKEALQKTKDLTTSGE
jgi:transposase